MKPNLIVIDSSARLKNGFHSSDIKEILDRMDKSDIHHAVIAPSDEQVAVYNKEGNDQILDLVMQYPDRFTGLATANPWYGRKALDILKQAFDSNLRGLYLHPGRQGFHLTESVLRPLIELCVEYHKPVFSHMGTPICSMPFQLAELARQYPETSFILGHFAYTDFAGYDVIPAAKQTSNLYVDTSCVCSNCIKAAVNELGAERVLFGSGYPRSMPGWEMEKMKNTGLCGVEFKKVMSENARQLWGVTI